MKKNNIQGYLDKFDTRLDKFVPQEKGQGFPVVPYKEMLTEIHFPLFNHTFVVLNELGGHWRTNLVTEIVSRDIETVGNKEFLVFKFKTASGSLYRWSVDYNDWVELDKIEMEYEKG